MKKIKKNINYFSYEREHFGIYEMVDLIPNGRNIIVKSEDRAEYV